MVGVSYQSMKQTLNASSVTTSTLEKIATALNVPMWQLFASPEEVRPKSDGLSLTCPHCGKDINIKVEWTRKLLGWIFSLASTNIQQVEYKRSHREHLRKSYNLLSINILHTQSYIKRSRLYCVNTRERSVPLFRNVGHLGQCIACIGGDTS